MRLARQVRTRERSEISLAFKSSSLPPWEKWEKVKRNKKMTSLNQFGFRDVVYNRKMPNNRDLNNIKFLSFSDKRKLKVDRADVAVPQSYQRSRLLL